MKKYRIILLILTAVVMSTMLEGCFKKGDNDPFISLRSRKARISKKWDVTDFNGNYVIIFDKGETRRIDLVQTDKKIKETIKYENMLASTRDSLSAGQDTSISWNGKIVEAYYDINRNGTFEFVYEYTLKKTFSKSYLENGCPDSISTFWPPFPGQNFTVDSTMIRNYRTICKGKWNFLHNVDGYKNRERIIFEIEDELKITNLATNYVFDAEDDDGVFPYNPVDTTFSRQSLESISNKYANGERNILWELDKLKNKEVTMKRVLDHVYTASYGIDGFKHVRKGSESIEMVPFEKK